MSVPGENAQPRATAEKNVPQAATERRSVPLEWQGELDTAMTDIDTRLRHPRRRATDGEQPTLPQLGQVELTSELLDEIAWRVAEQIRRSLPSAPDSSPEAVEPEPERMAPGIALTIRIRRPLFRFRFWRRRVKRKSLIQFSESRVP
jgi:hypothetical protein